MPSPKTHTFAPDSLLTSYQVGTLLQVNPSSVNKWIADGRIPAYRTPGGHRRIKATDLLHFLKTHKMPVPKGLHEKAHQVLGISDQPTVFKQMQVDGHSPAMVLTLAADGVDGMLKAGALAPDIVVLGPTVAPLDTLDVCRRLRASAQGAGLKIVMVTDPGVPELERRARSAGADALCPQPVTHAALVAALALSGS